MGLFDSIRKAASSAVDAIVDVARAVVGRPAPRRAPPPPPPAAPLATVLDEIEREEARAAELLAERERFAATLEPEAPMPWQRTPESWRQFMAYLVIAGVAPEIRAALQAQYDELDGDMHRMFIAKIIALVDAYAAHEQKKTGPEDQVRMTYLRAVSLTSLGSWIQYLLDEKGAEIVQVDFYEGRLQQHGRARTDADGRATKKKRGRPAKKRGRMTQSDAKKAAAAERSRKYRARKKARDNDKDRPRGK